MATAKGYRYAASIQPGDEVLSFNPQTFLPGRSTVRRAVRRKSEEVLRVFVSGRVIEATPEHRFVRFTDGGYELVRADALKPGDHLPIQRIVPAVEVEPTFELSDAILTIAEEGRRILHAGYKRSGKTYDDLSSRIGISRNHLRNVLQPRPFRRSLRAGVLSALCRALDVDATGFAARYVRGIRGPIQCVAFYELLGYVVADGCFARDHLSIVDKDLENLRIYSGKFADAFGETPSVVPGAHRNFELKAWSLPLGRFLNEILEHGLARSRKRLVPEFVFTLPAEKRAAFVRGYFDGEGWVGDHQVCATSASLPLLRGIQVLLASLAIEGHIHTVRPGAGTFGHEFYSLTISDVHAFGQAVGFCAPAKSAKLSTVNGASFEKTVFLPKRLVAPLLQEVKARGVVHTIPHHQTIYDVLSGRIKANPASLRRILSSFDSPTLATLLDGKVVLGTVKRVERIVRAETVVDLVLSGQPYFVANQVITHNCDPEFEAFLLEVLSDFQVSIPEIGTISAKTTPYVVLTSNRTRELGDALRRRCLYLWIDYPTFEKELEIVHRKVPEVNGRLAEQISAFMQMVRRLRLEKTPGVAETLDWSAALMALHRDHLDREAVEQTLGVLFKHHDDAAAVRGQWIDQLLDGVAALEREGRPWSQDVVARAAERLQPRR
ncbi:MAG: LAGLIDADG family homing endonuclease [Armatimonadota bacterium]